VQKITPIELDQLAGYINDISGIVLDQTKAYLIESRLGPLLEREGLPNYSSLKNKAVSDKSGRLATLITDAISTNETSFFRDKHPFDLLVHKLAPDRFEVQMSKAGILKPSLSIWCAASSTGQEIYSIAMSLKELLGSFNSYRIKILGTDISKTALSVASMGKYSKLEISRGISSDRLRRHFTNDGDIWRVSDELRSVTQFRHTNLLSPTMLGKFDIIFCRYVAIYFSTENRKILFEKLANSLTDGGILVIGGTESIIGLSKRFSRKQFHNSTYYELI